MAGNAITFELEEFGSKGWLVWLKLEEGKPASKQENSLIVGRGDTTKDALQDAFHALKATTAAVALARERLEDGICGMRLNS